ncbi:MAG: phosphoribosyltransferase [Candidatus Taylorbacteria bacterium]|nr:phosphoribosyltransferase [Candidatus Taylorbacteria bacterium]
MKLKRLSDTEIKQILELMDAVNTGHFVGASGAHLDTYIDKDAPGSHPIHLMHLGHELAHRINEVCRLEDNDIVALVGAPMGAISLGAFTAYWLNTLFPREDGIVIQSLYAEKTSLTDDKAPFKLRSSYAEKIKEHGVIAIEDILNSGGSAQKTIDIIEKCGGKAIGVGALCNRGGVTADKLGVRFVVSLIDLNLQKWDVPKGEECPLCKRDVLIDTRLGHGQRFLDEQKQKA